MNNVPRPPLPRSVARACAPSPISVSIRQYASAYVSKRQQTSANVSKRTSSSLRGGRLLLHPPISGDNACETGAGGESKPPSMPGDVRV